MKQSPHWEPWRNAAIAAELLAVGLSIWFLCSGLSVAARAQRNHAVYQDDDVIHYFLARDGWQSPQTVWYNWSRPGYSFPVMFVAHFFGFWGCRVFSSLQTAAVGYLAYRIARRLMPPPADAPPSAADWVFSLAPALAPALVWAQPMTAILSQTSLTETPASLYLTLGVFLFLRGNLIGACIAWSPCFATRTEMAALAPLMLLAVGYAVLKAEGFVFGPWHGRLAHASQGHLAPGTPGKPMPVQAVERRGKMAVSRAFAVAMAALAWAPALWIVVCLLIAVPAELGPLGSFTRHYTGLYGSGTACHYLRGWLLEAAGGGVLALAVAGTIALGRRGLLPALLAVALVALHTLIYLRGAFESGGYMRFLVPITGLVAALAACGAGFLLRDGSEVVLWLVRRCKSNDLCSPQAKRLSGVSGRPEPVEGRRCHPQGYSLGGAVTRTPYSGLAVAAALGVLAAWVHWGTTFDPDTVRALLQPLLESRLIAALAGAASPPAGLDARLDAFARLAVLTLLAVGVLAAVIPLKGLRRAVSVAAVAVAAYAAFTQYSLQVKPLELNREGVQIAAVDALGSLAATDRPGPRPAMTAYAVIAFVDERIQLVGSCAESVQRWRSAAPGTLYYWDSKYGRRPEGNDPNSPLFQELARLGIHPRGDDGGPLHEELTRGGRLIWPAAAAGNSPRSDVEVFERLPDRR